MNRLGFGRLTATSLLALLAAGCAVRPVPDPRNPGALGAGVVTMRVCFVDGDGAHVAVGDQIQFITNKLGRLRIRHIPGPNNREGAWNGGEDVKVKSAVLVEQTVVRDAKRNPRRFVPVGRFPVRVHDGRNEHAPFDFLASKTTTATRNHAFPECNADVGDDEVLIRGVKDNGRHGGTIILR